MSGAPPPSSFDHDPDFFEESRWQKFKRRLLEEPLIPFGVALTCWALYEASRSIRARDSTRANRMFRRRIYAQGFTLVAVLAGQRFWAVDRGKRKKYEELVDEKARKEKQAAWIRELEEREREEEELMEERRRMREEGMKARAERERVRRDEAAALASAEAVEAPQKASATATDTARSIRSVLEPSETRLCTGIRTAALAVLGGRWSQ